MKYPGIEKPFMYLSRKIKLKKNTWHVITVDSAYGNKVSLSLDRHLPSFQQDLVKFEGQFGAEKGEKGKKSVKSEKSEKTGKNGIQMKFITPLVIGGVPDLDELTRIGVDINQFPFEQRDITMLTDLGWTGSVQSYEHNYESVASLLSKNIGGGNYSPYVEHKCWSRKPCGDQSECVPIFDTFACDCQSAPDFNKIPHLHNFDGKTCAPKKFSELDLPQKNIRLFGDQTVFLNRNITDSLDSVKTVSFRFKTKFPDGLIYYQEGGEAEFLAVVVSHGVLRLISRDNLKNGGVAVGRTRNGKRVANGKWHSLKLVFDRENSSTRNVFGQLDRKYQARLSNFDYSDFVRKPNGMASIGGSSSSRIGRASKINFRGCIAAVSFEAGKFTDFKDLRAVINGDGRSNLQTLQDCR